MSRYTLSARGEGIKPTAASKLGNFSKHDPLNKKAPAEVERIARAIASIKPSEKLPSIDRKHIWLKQPLARSDLHSIRRQSGPRKLYVSYKKPHPYWPYNQQLQICQPNHHIFELLSKRNDALLNYAEVALDLTFNSEEERDDAYELICRLMVKTHHRSQNVKFAGEQGSTRYWASRGSPNVPLIYRDRASKVTGEVYCVHIEWRFNGAPALRRQKIENLSDLMQLDHRQFWNKRLRLFAVDLTRLGRMQQNFQRRSKRRLPWIIQKGRLSYDVDYRTGCILMRVFGSTQAVIDEWKWIPVSRCLAPISVGHLLPAENELGILGKCKEQKGLQRQNAIGDIYHKGGSHHLSG